MGCDIHSFAEVRNKKTGKWEKVNDAFTLDDFDKKMRKKDKGDHPFDGRNYSVFAFLADVRNYDHCEPISQPKGIPADACQYIKDEWERWTGDGHSASFLTLRELQEFDYEKKFWNRRVMKQTSPNIFDGRALAEEGEGNILSYRENLGEWFFLHLKELSQLGNPDEVRIVFWFDN